MSLLPCQECERAVSTVSTSVSVSLGLALQVYTAILSCFQMGSRHPDLDSHSYVASATRTELPLSLLGAFFQRTQTLEVLQGPPEASNLNLWGVKDTISI